MLPVYIDLWAAGTAEPGALVAESIGAEIRALDDAAVRLARSVGLPARLSPLYIRANPARSWGCPSIIAYI